MILSFFCGSTVGVSGRRSGGGVVSWGRTGLAGLALLLAVGCSDPRPTVVVYTSVDDVFARPVLASFEEATGVRVLPVFDVEAQKTTGLYHRLLAEKERPRADVFWNSEVARTLQLAAADVLAPYASEERASMPATLRSPDELWTGFGLRARIIVYNRDLVSPEDVPASIRDLALPRFRGKAAIANPLFGTTTTHVGALWVEIGPERTQALLEEYLANGVHVLAGNSTVRDRVARGELEIGLTDTDDANVALIAGLPIGIVFPDQEPAAEGEEALGTFGIPNTVALIAGAPHEAEGKRLIDFLLSPATEEALARGESAQIPVRAGLEGPPRLDLPPDLRWMEVDYDAVARGVREATPWLEERFATR